MTFDFININAEAKAFTASKKGEKYSLSNAVLINNFAKALVFNFYLKINIPNVPTKVLEILRTG